MNELLIYLLKSAGLLSIFYVFYQILLKADTSFVRNRKFLLSGIAAAALLPAFYFTRTVTIQNPLIIEQFQSAIAGQNAISSQEGIDWWLFGGILYLTVFTILFSKFLFQISTILKLISGSAKKTSTDFKYIETGLKTSPFSFFHFIVFNPNLHSQEELKLILEHEKVHARQKHSIDIILTNLMVALLWFNPLSWWYKKSIEQNLEFIADSEAVKNSASKTEYQKTLVKVSTGALAPVLSNNFYQSSIKKRIIMLNKKSNSENKIWKIAFIFPAVLTFMLIFNVEVKAQESSAKNKVEPTSEAKAVKYIQEQHPLVIVNGEVQAEDFNVVSIPTERIASVHVLKGSSALKKYGKKGKNGVMEITLKSGVETSAPSEAQSKYFGIYIDEDADPFEKWPDISTALIVIDGKMMKDDFKVNSINQEKIESVNVLKGEAATEKYGREGEKGAIEITLKKN